MQQNQTFGNRIREERKRLGLTQQQLADGLAVSRSAVTFYETDRTVPDMTFGLRANANGIDAWYIMTGERGREAAAHLFDWDLFAQILSGIRHWCENEKFMLSAAKELAVARLLYKHFSKLGVIDEGFMEETMKLAA